MAVSQQLFKEALAHWASGVTVVTTIVDGGPIGITASSFASVSLDPPQILVCVAKKLYTHGALEKSGVFAVNILGVDQIELGMRFAGLIPEIEDRFAGLHVETAVTGSPILGAALGWVDCKLRHAYDGGDHTIFVGEVEAAQAQNDGLPLLYYNRNWRALAPDPVRFEG